MTDPFNKGTLLVRKNPMGRVNVRLDFVQTIMISKTCLVWRPNLRNVRILLIRTDNVAKLGNSTPRCTAGLLHYSTALELHSVFASNQGHFSVEIQFI